VYSVTPLPLAWPPRSPGVLCDLWPPRPPAAILCEGLTSPTAATVELKTEPLPYTGEPLPPHLTHDGSVPGNKLNPFLYIRGFSCPCCVQASLSLNCLKLTIPGFAHNCLPVSCGDIGLNKNLGLVLAWKSGLNVPFLSLGCSCPLHTILLSDLVVCDSPLQIMMSFWGIIIVSRGRAVTPECKKAITICRGLSHPLDGHHCPLITYQGVFFQDGETL
jgi:hypothetical protein